MEMSEQLLPHIAKYIETIAHMSACICLYTFTYNDINMYDSVMYLTNLFDIRNTYLRFS